MSLLTAVSASTTTSDDDEPDTSLIEQARDGNDRAFATLWSRHADAGIRAARQITSRFDPEDIVLEAFTRILAAVRGGKGPTDAFRPYLYATVRRVSMNWARDRSAESTLEDLGAAPDPDAVFEDPALERDVVGRAFAGLKEDWRAILWYTEVEGMPVREAAPYLGLSPNAAAALAHRAREGLRTAWLQAHVSGTDDDERCRWTTKHLGAYQRQLLVAKHQRRVEDHLGTCPRCAARATEVATVATRLRSVLLPLVLGTGAALLDPDQGPAAVTSAATGRDVDSTVDGTTSTTPVVTDGKRARALTAASDSAQLTDCSNRQAAPAVALPAPAYTTQVGAAPSPPPIAPIAIASGPGVILLAGITLASRRKKFHRSRGTRRRSFRQPVAR